LLASFERENNRQPRNRVKPAALFLLVSLSSSFGEWPMVPSEPDQHTLHLWHLDEKEPPFADSGTFPKPLLGLLQGATADERAMEGFGRSVSFTATGIGPRGSRELRGPILVASAFSRDGFDDNVEGPFPICGDDGAFTIEAIVQFDVLPPEAQGTALGIVSMDDESDAWRVFNFRIEKPGFLSFLQLSTAGAVSGLATIPTSGPHAINRKDWFHVAVTCDGRWGMAGNLKLYWTRLSPGLTSANLIGEDSLPGPLSKSLGDFAIGNLGRRWECDPFPGRIDEVRISSVARKPFDFCFIPRETRVRLMGQSQSDAQRSIPLVLRRFLVDNVPTTVGDSGIKIGPGRHRLDVDFEFSARTTPATSVSWRLDGLEEKWQTSGRGMSLTCEVLDLRGNVISEASFVALGQSPGWDNDMQKALHSQGVQPLFLPSGSHALRISISSGPSDTTGIFLIDDLSVSMPGAPRGQEELWTDGAFSKGTALESQSGCPDNWIRSGSEPAIARVVTRFANHYLALVDTDAEKSAAWSSTQLLPPIPTGGRTVLVRWTEEYNVIGGSSHRATYMNIPPGQFTLRAIAVTGNSEVSTELAVPITVLSPVWRQPWFLPVSTLIGGVLVGLTLFQGYRTRSRRRLRRVQAQHALERERARIARDMHDDLGTRVTVLTMTASFIQRDMHRDPTRVRHHLTKLASTARDLVTAMEGLVWAVNPNNDNLDQLVNHLVSLVQEIFRDSHIRILLFVPSNLPRIGLRSEFRHHFALCVKEALHNVLKHAGKCEGAMDLRIEGSVLVAVITDHGIGFDTETQREGNGLAHLKSRMSELGGACIIQSAIGRGTSITLQCPLNLKTELP
jgi:signal transduction histidine kinase